MCSRRQERSVGVPAVVQDQIKRVIDREVFAKLRGLKITPALS
jgi:hypothetical protein